MIQTLALFAALALATATPAKAAGFDETDVKVCEMFGVTARAIMTGRQYGLAPSEVRRRLQKVVEENNLPFMTKVIDIYIVDAYKQDSFMSEKMRQCAIDSFQSDKEIECLNLNNDEA